MFEFLYSVKILTKFSLQWFALIFRYLLVLLVLSNEYFGLLAGVEYSFEDFIPAANYLADMNYLVLRMGKYNSTNGMKNTIYRKN